MEHHPTHQKILDEAIRIIETSGEASLRVHDIEVAVDVTPPSIYHFFGSREGLVIAAQEERLVRSFAEFNAVSASILRGVSSRAELRDAFLNILTMIYDPSRSLARQQRLFALGSVEGRPELAVVLGEAARSFLRQLAENFQVFKDIGWTRPDLDLEAFIQWLAGQILGRVYIEIGCEPAPNPAWDAISIEAVMFVAFGSLSD
jgi:AcrR family transcriptional regulator